MEWQPQTTYDFGSKVIHHGITYQIIQPHTSQVGWEPSLTPALWNQVEGATSQPTSQHPPPQTHVQHQPQPSAEQQQTSGYTQPASEVKPSDTAPTYESKDEKSDGQKHEGKPEEKKQVAAGVLGATALAGIGGVAAYKFQKHHSDDQKRAAWIEEVTTMSQNDQRENKPFFWVTTEGKYIPPTAIQCGTDGDGAPLFAARANMKMGCNIGYGNKEISIKKYKYQILCGNPKALKWVDLTGPCITASLQNAQPIEAGQENDGRPLYVAQAFYNNSVQVGKAGAHINDGMFFPYGGKEVVAPSYKVVCFA
ncbi:hypothetical protein BC829DRAFT_397521 [Chytridium lagenaria]|nr:hypothetical protein BC829DRAFT_397521 [Chytridium lagenaria]